METNNEIVELVNTLSSNFSVDALSNYIFYKFPNFDYSEENLKNYTNEYFTNLQLLGKTQLDDGTYFAVVAIEHCGELSERSGKHRQFDLAKRILRERLLDAGFFVFYDHNGNFRFSLVFTIYKGTRREYNYFKRYTYFVEKGKYYYTFSKALIDLQTDSLDSIIAAFNVEIVTEEFFDAYRFAIREKIIPNLIPNTDDLKTFAFAQLLLSRILFIYFLQKKRWLKWDNHQPDVNYLRNLWYFYKNWKKENKVKNLFYSDWLASLFFGAFNKKYQKISNKLPKQIIDSFKLMPYLNGGLFSETELDTLNFSVPDSIFDWLFEPDNIDKRKGFLEIFNFTIDESSPIDVEVAVDPEMLGKVYESLILDEERGGAGIFYTPRVEIDFMCRLALCEYLARNSNVPKELIIDFIFEPSHVSVGKLPPEALSSIKNLLNDIKIVDPAVGSASFIVGMMNILVELHQELTRKIENREENLFALKEKILKDNLYGVDVKDWAVMVGELRLWLSLVIDTNEQYIDIYNKPLLPNLSFKIRQGDSLVEEIGGVQLSLRNQTSSFLSASYETKLKELIDRKNAFFSGQSSQNLPEIREIEKMEQAIFSDILQNKINQISTQIRNLEFRKKASNSKSSFFQKIPGTRQGKSNLDNEIESLEKEKNKLLSALNNVQNKTKKDYFLWEVDFAEVFAEKGGFDIVIGNPPYVRQELIAPPLEVQNNYSADHWRLVKEQYKNKLIEAVRNSWPNLKKIDKKSDLYVYFYYQSLSILKPNGIFCFINSNSWLDVGYGTGLQEFLLKNMKPIYIIDNLKKRSFKQADVNTIIVLIQKPEEKPDDYILKFVAFKKPFEDVINADVIKRIEKLDNPVFDDEDFRIFPKTKKELLLEGVEEPEEENLIKDLEHLPYIGNKWGGKYLRAPEIYFKILEKGKGKLVRLGDIAHLQRGLVTGLDTYLFISEEKIKELNLEMNFLKKVLVSPRQCKRSIVKASDINTFAIYTNKTKKELKGTEILKYIERCEIEGALKRATAKDKSTWYICREQKIGFPCIAIPRAPYIRFPIFLIMDEILINDMVVIEPYNKSNTQIIFLIIISTMGLFLLETHSRHNLGLGTLKFERFDAVHHPILNINLLPKSVRERIINQLKPISMREIHSIFTELGFDPHKPIREQEPNPLPDRKALDDIVFDALGLTEEERKEVYWAVAELVKNRLDKAKSV